MKNKNSISDILSQGILRSIENQEFKWDLFFKYWYREQGTPLFFLFKKNLSVTNTQYAELFCLLNKYCKREDKEENKLLFYSTEHIKTTFTEVISTIIDDNISIETLYINTFSSQYIDIFKSSIAVDMFFGSCAVFLPYGISVDLEQVVADSGYIHSAGYSVFIRNIKKSTKNIFLFNIDQYLEKEKENEKIPFIVFSHEDFSGYDKDSSELNERGIEQCKMFVDKMSMGCFRLSSILSEMQNSPRYNKLMIPKGGDYHIEHIFKSTKSLFLISDRSISSGQLKNPGMSRYYICYEQILKNDSPFFYFDENKPAWKSHTTLPHSLTAALLNISRNYLNHGKICDPFCGTGTTWFEVKRLNLNNELFCSDLSASTKLLVSDNLRFFLMSTNDLEKLSKELSFCYPERSLPDQYQLNFSKEDNIYLDPYAQALQLINELKQEQPEEDQEFDLSDSFVIKLNKLSLLYRIVFYVALRAELRFQGSFKRHSLTIQKAYELSLEKMIKQIRKYKELKECIESDDLESAKWKHISYIRSKDTYSNNLIPSFIFHDFAHFDNLINKEIIQSHDARCLNKNSNDLVICDPPYGFNTTENSSALADLYINFIDTAIDSLKPNGQLIICLPAESYTGRDLPYCTRSDLVSRQIIMKAHQKNRLVYRPAQSLPIISLNPPYYWEAERALRRVILHFFIL